MKKSFLPVLVVIALCPAVAFVVRLAVHASVNALNVPALVGVLFCSSLLLLAFSDYSRRPRFHAGGVRKPVARASTPVTSRDVDAASAWTCPTFSA